MDEFKIFTIFTFHFVIMPSKFHILLTNIQAFRKKYYLNHLIKGSLYGVGILTAYFILLNVIEYFIGFNSWVRTFLFFGSLSIAGFIVIKMIILPFMKMIRWIHTISDSEAAIMIGNKFPDVQDKLLNTLQLMRLPDENPLIKASIEQRTSQLATITFPQAVDLKKNKKAAPYMLIPIIILILLLITIPGIITESTTRIVHYKKEFIPPAPFQFILLNKDLTAFRNEDFEVSMITKGKVMPENVYIVTHEVKQKLISDKNGVFRYLFNSVQKVNSFRFEGEGFYSTEYTLNVHNRPLLNQFEVLIEYPSYLNKSTDKLKNTGDLIVPYGTEITWKFYVAHTDSLRMEFSGNKIYATPVSEGIFLLKKQQKDSEPYSVNLINKFAANKEKAAYRLVVIEDKAPVIRVDQIRDTVLYSLIVANGTVSDDYGLTGLKLFYKHTNVENSDTGIFRTIPIKLNGKSVTQNFFHEWDISYFHLKPDDELSYYFQVWDNDRLQGPKSTRSPIYTFRLPDKRALSEETSAETDQVKNDLQKALANATQLKKEMEKIQEKLKSEKQLEWSDKKQIEKILEQQKNLHEQLENINERNRLLNRKSTNFDQLSEQVVQKVSQLQELMDQLLDEKTRKMMEELEKMLGNQDNEKVNDYLDKFKKDQKSLEKELDRALELYKQLQAEKMTEKVMEDLKSLSQKQSELASKIENGKKEELVEKSNELSEEQNKINNEFEQIKKDIKELQTLNKELQQPNTLPNTNEQEQKISENLENSKESLSNKNPKKATPSQKKAAEDMKDMAQKIESSKKQDEMEAAEENMEDLRAILENLLKLSFDQEELMKDFRNIKQSDPKYLEYTQQQYKLIDDLSMIEDSLVALAKRVFQIQSFIIRELSGLHEYMDASIQLLRDRDLNQATGKQQFSMTSINNLALLLDEVLKQMQENNAESKPGTQNCQKKSGKKSCNKPGGKSDKLSDIQKDINKKISDLKKGGKQGKELSEQLARLAAQQEMLRNALREMDDPANNGKNGNNDELKELAKNMEDTETDLVNKRLNEQMIRRQQEILTRLLDAEDAFKERDLDEKRESETAKDILRDSPAFYDKYIQLRKKQLDLLKTVPPALTPYYKEQTNEYFEKINGGN